MEQTPDHQTPGINIFRTYTAQDVYDQLKTVLFSPPYSPPPGRQSRILLKPNCNANMNALTGNTTDLRIISGLIRLLKDLGYSNLVIGEGTNSGYYRNNISVMNRLKLDRLARFYGAELLDLNFEPGHPIVFDNGVRAGVAQICLESDYFINLPKLKTHFEAGMSVCLKNLMGCLVGQENKKKTHDSLASNIVNINKALKPDLHIVDGLVAMEGLGPTRGTPKLTDMMMIGNDPYLVDMVCARLAGFSLDHLPVLSRAMDQGIVSDTVMETARQHRVKGTGSPFLPPKAGPIASFIHSPKRQKYFLKIRNTPFFTYLAATDWFGHILFVTGLRQDVFCKEETRYEGLSLDSEKCKACGLCTMFCPLGLDPRQVFEHKTQDECLDCLYCYLVCPESAYRFHGTLGFLQEQIRQYDKRVRSFDLHYQTIKTLPRRIV